MSTGSPGSGAEFLAEAGEIIERIQEGVTALDQALSTGEVSPHVLNDLFRSAHSLKGLAGLFGEEPLVGLAHAFEDLLHAMRLGKCELTPDLLRLLDQACDAFARARVTLGRGEHLVAEQLSSLEQQLARAADGSPAEGEGSMAGLELPDRLLSVLTEYEEHRLRENARLGTPLYMLRATLSLDRFDTDLAAISEKLNSLGEVLTTLPGSDAPDGYIEFSLLFATQASQSEWQASIPMDAGELHVEPVRRTSAALAPSSSTDKPEEATEARVAPASIGDSIRVDLRKLDVLMGVVGELGLVRAEVSRALVDLRRLEGAHFVSLQLQRVARTFERHLGELQQGIMDVRMVPVRVIFDRLARSARRTARELGKNVRIQMQGEETELDKVLVEEMNDPLMHMVRNAIDHGIESADRREALGKAPHGTVTLRAFSKGRHVVIEVGDDGAGLDLVGIRRRALELNLVDEERVGSLSEREIYDLLFLPGFSTRKKVTELSGRGVGMDVVKTNIGRVSGVIDVRSQAGKGATFAITLPITLAIMQALVVEVASQLYALPLSSVLEIRTLQAREVKTIEGREVIFGRDETIPLTWLSDVFGLERSAAQGELQHVVVVGLAQTRVGIVVDALQGQQDIIIKPMGRLLGGVRGVAGATDLGAQGLVLVLDVAELAVAGPGRAVGS